MSRTLRIAAQHHGGAVRGRELVRLLAALSALGHAVRVYHDDTRVRDMALGADLVARRLPLSGSIGLHRARRLGRELRSRRVDVVLLDPRTVWLGALGARWGRGARAAVRIGELSDLPSGRPAREAWERWLHLVVFDVAALEPHFREAVPGWAGESRVIAPGALPPATRGGTTFRARAGVPLDGFLIGTHGPGLDEPSAYEPLFRILEAVPRAHGVLLTAGPPRSRVEKEAQRRGLLRRIHAVAPASDPGPALDALDLYLRPGSAAAASPEVLEALAAGVPVLTRPAPGVEEVLGEAVRSPDGSVPGLVFTEPEEAAAAIETLCADRALKRRMDEAAKRRAESRFDFGRAVTEWEAALLELASGRNDG